MSSPEINLLKGTMPTVTKMKVNELRQECEMWRNMWGWIPPEVKYYIARTGQVCGVTMRNYKRYLGVLVDTHWVLDEIELGVIDKVYDNIKEKHMIETKVVKVNANAMLNVEWIKKVQSEEEFEAEVQKEIEGMPEDSSASQENNNNNK